MIKRLPDSFIILLLILLNLFVFRASQQKVFKHPDPRFVQKIQEEVPVQNVQFREEPQFRQVEEPQFQVAKHEPIFEFVDHTQEKPQIEEVNLRSYNLRARLEKKNLFLYFGAEWCGWCRRMQEETFEDNDVKIILESFEYVYVDKDMNPTLKERFSVDGIPDYIILTPDGIEVKRGKGFKNKETFLRWLKNEKGE